MCRTAELAPTEVEDEEGDTDGKDGTEDYQARGAEVRDSVSDECLRRGSVHMISRMELG